MLRSGDAIMIPFRFISFWNRKCSNTSGTASPLLIVGGAAGCHRFSNSSAAQKSPFRVRNLLFRRRQTIVVRFYGNQRKYIL